MPHAETLPSVGARCGALRVRDAGQNWRIMYRLDKDAVVILEVYGKKTRKIPEQQLLDARTQMAAAVREARESSNLSQKELGQRLKTSQPRIAKIERAASDVSLDQLVRAFVAAGGRFVVKSKRR